MHIIIIYRSMLHRVCALIITTILTWLICTATIAVHTMTMMVAVQMLMMLMWQSMIFGNWLTMCRTRHCCWCYKLLMMYWRRWWWAWRWSIQITKSRKSKTAGERRLSYFVLKYRLKQRLPADKKKERKILYTFFTSALTTRDKRCEKRRVWNQQYNYFHINHYDETCRIIFSRMNKKIIACMWEFLLKIL